MRQCFLLIGFLIFTACSSDSGDGNGPAGGGTTCAADEFMVTGTLDGDAVSHQGVLDGHAWVQASAGSTLDTPFEGGGSFHAAWSKVVADGETFTATGNINLPVGGPHGGETLDYSSGSLTKLDDEVRFEISGLSASVTCIAAPCPNGAVAGSLQGCVHWAPFGANP
jgi:hypothetical protein